MRVILILLVLPMITVTAWARVHYYKFCHYASDELINSDMIAIWSFFDPTSSSVVSQAKKFKEIAHDLNELSGIVPEASYFAIMASLDESEYHSEYWDTVLPTLYDFSNFIDDIDLDIWFTLMAATSDIIIVNKCGLMRARLEVDWESPNVLQNIKDVILKVDQLPCQCSLEWIL